MKLNFKYNINYLTILSGIFISLVLIAQAQTRPQLSQRSVSTKLKAYKGIHENSLANRFILKKNTRMGRLNAFANRKVPTGKQGKLMPLSLVASKLLNKHELFQNQLRRVPATAFFNGKRPLRGIPMVIETPTEFVIILETHMLIQNPKTFNNAPGMDLFQRQQLRGRQALKANQHKRNLQKTNLLNGKSKQGRELTLYMNRLKNMPQDHPLKSYAMKNDRAGIVKAIAEGKGEMTMTTTVAIPKTRMIAPKPLDRAQLNPQHRLKQINRINPATLGLGHIRKLPQLVTIKCVGKSGSVRPGNGEDGDGALKVRTGGAHGAQEIFHLSPVGDGLYPAYHIDSAYAHGFGISSRDGKEPLNAATALRAPSNNVRTIKRNSPATIHPRSTYGFIPVKGKANIYKIHDLELDKYLVVDRANRVVAKGNKANASQFQLTPITHWKPSATFSIGGFRGDKSTIKFKFNPAGRPKVRMISRVNFASKTATKTNPLRMKFGSAVTVTPSHPDYLFVPESRTIGFRNNGNYGFNVIPRASGSMNVDAKLLSGYTIAQGFNWEVAYSYPSGRFSAGAYAELAFGLRAPIQVNGSVSPRTLNLKKGEKMNMTVKLKAKGVDANAAYYEHTGLSGLLVQDGSEFVLNAKAGYHLYLEALWEVYVDERWEKSFNYNRDMRFPVGTNDRSTLKRWWIPPALTYSDFSNVDDVNLGIDIIDATISLGARLDLVRGKAKVRVTPNLAGRNHPSKILVLSPEKSHTFKLNSSSVAKNTPFGVSIDLIDYSFGITLTPSIKLDAPVKIDLFFDSFERNFGTTVDLPELSISLGEFRLPKHKGTHAHQITGGSATAR